MKHSASLVDFLNLYKSQHPKDVFLVNEEINVEYESTAHYKLLEQKNPLIWFSKVKDYPDFQLVTNVMGSRARMAFALRLGSEYRTTARQSKNEFLQGRMSIFIVFLLLNTIQVTARIPDSGATSLLVWQ